MLRRCAFPAWFFIVLDLFPDTFSACMRCVNFNFVYFWSYPDLFPHTEKRHLSYLSNILQSKPPVKRVVWESPIRAYCGHCPLSGLRKVCQLHFILSYPLRGILFLFLTVLLSGKRIHWFKQTQLIICNIVLQLVPYVFFYSLLIFPYCIHIVLSAYGYDPDTLLPLWFRFLSAHTVFSVFFQCLFLFGYISPFFCISVQIPLVLY